MRLYDNDEYRDKFMELVYSLLYSDGTNDRANQIIDAFDAAPAVEAEPLPPNAPLTLEELREMDGEPVWVESINCPSGWCLVEADGPYNMMVTFYNEWCGKTWWVYRRRPEGGDSNA